MLGKLLKRALGGTALGCLDFVRNSNLPAVWGGPFNGQRFRQHIFFDILYHFPVAAIIETGTYRGTTTRLFAATSLPVYTAEVHPRYFWYSKLHFWVERNSVHLYKSDSRSFLRRLSQDPRIPKADVFFYLDAHWGEDLPLREELEIVFSAWTRPIVMIDDFCVPDSHYTFDSYGPQKTLDLSYISPVISARGISAFFPAADASAETGSKRGCIVLCDNSLEYEFDARVKSLRRYKPASVTGPDTPAFSKDEPALASHLCQLTA